MMLRNSNLLNIEPKNENILLVEDEAILALSESMMLEKHGYSIEIVYTGEAAIEIIDKGMYPDLILMDIDLGDGYNGIETAEIILSQCKIPIIFLTSHTSNEIARKIIGITMYGYIHKNSDENIILSTIKMALEHFRKESAIEQENHFLKRIEKTARIGYWQVIPETSKINLSEECKEILGSDTDCCPFDVFENLVLQEYRDSRSIAFRELIEYGKPYEMIYQIKKKESGTLITVRSLGRKFQNMIVGVLQDITEMVNHQSASYKSEQLQDVILRSNKDGVILTDITGRIIEINKTAESITGWDKKKPESVFINDIFNIKDALTDKPVLNLIDNIVSSGTIVNFMNDAVLVSKDGMTKHIVYSVIPIFNDNGQIFSTVFVFRDVTQEYHKREAIKKNERIFRTIFLESHTPMLLIDMESGKIEKVNQAAKDFCGGNTDELKNIVILNTNTTDTALSINNLKNTMGENYNQDRFSHQDEGGQTRNFQVISDQLSIDNKEYLLSLIFNTDKERIQI